MIKKLIFLCFLMIFTGSSLAKAYEIEVEDGRDFFEVEQKSFTLNKPRRVLYYDRVMMNIK